MNLLVIQTAGGHDYLEYASSEDMRYAWGRLRVFQVLNDPAMEISGEGNGDVLASAIVSIFTASATGIGWNKLNDLTIQSSS